MYESMDGSVGVLCMQVWTGRCEFCVCKYGRVNGSYVYANMVG